MIPRLKRALPAGLELSAQASVDLHLHTNWTDGDDEPLDMLRAAQTMGLTAVLFSEHVRASSVAWFPDFAAHIRALPQSSCRAYVGAEVKILDMDGGLDVAPEILELCEVTVGVVHRFPGEGAIQPRPTMDPRAAMELEYRLSLTLVEQARVHVLGHPFGMTVRRFGHPLPLDLLYTLARRAAENGVAMEFNAKYHTSPSEVLGVYASAGALVSIGSDAHCAADVGRATRILEMGAVS